MTLTQEDLDKIQAVINARADLQDAKSAQKFAQLESIVATKSDLQLLETRMGDKIDSVKTMLEGDHRSVVEDVEVLKVQVKELQAHHA